VRAGCPWAITVANRQNARERTQILLARGLVYRSIKSLSTRVLVPRDDSQASMVTERPVTGTFAEGVQPAVD
jgi:hypothetical protein